MSTNTAPSGYCDIGRYVYRHVVGGGNTAIWQWMKSTKIPNTYSFSVEAGTTINAPEGTIIDVIRDIAPVTGQVQTALIIYDSSVNGGDAPDYPKFYLRKVLITGSNGSNKMVLLKVEATSSPSLLRVYCFNFVSEEVEVFDFDAPPCIDDFSFPTSSIIKSKCSGYTRTQFYHDGNGGVTTVNVVNSPQCGYVAPTIESTVSKKQRIEIRQACKNPIFIKWKNLLGGWDQWVFERKQTLSTDIVSRGTLRRTVFDIDQITNPVTELGKDSQPKMVLGADDLTSQQKIGLMQLLTSNKVMILNQDMVTFREVRITPGSFLIRETDAGSNSIEFEVIEPEINTIGN